MASKPCDLISARFDGMKKIILNLVLFQLGWVVCVIGGSAYAVAFTLPALLLHKWLVLAGPFEWKLIALVAVVGSLWDIGMAQSGVIEYSDAMIFGIPLWLLCLWLLFATTFMHALFWMHRYPWLAALLAAVLGPASYWIGTKLTDASLALPLWSSLGIMAAGWAILFPFGLLYAGKLKS